MKKPDYIAAKAQVCMHDLLEHYLDADELAAFKQKGAQLRGSCFLCDTKKRSTLSINTERNCFQSFCCKEKGNILDFVAAKEDVQIDDAVGLLFDWFDIEMEAPGDDGLEKNQVPTFHDDHTNKTLKFKLKNIDSGHEEVRALNISEETATLFGIGYYAGRGMFKDHVVFPIHNLAGDLVAYAGLADKDGDIVYPDNFRRDLALYNAHRIRDSLEYNPNPVIVANSILDVVRLYESGVDHPVGTMSGIISQEQIDLIATLSSIPFESYELENAQIVEPVEIQTMHDTVATYDLSDDEILDRGADILASRMKRNDSFKNPNDAKEFLKRKLSHLEREVFMCLYLDNKNQLIAFEDLFAGTIDQVSVYPREIVKQSLKHNTSALIVGHNHPSMNPEPSAADKDITKKIKDALDTLDIRLLDHIIVGGDETCSLAERGYI